MLTPPFVAQTPRRGEREREEDDGYTKKLEKKTMLGLKKSAGECGSIFEKVVGSEDMNVDRVRRMEGARSFGCRQIVGLS